jgi:putative MFS transporter
MSRDQLLDTREMGPFHRKLLFLSTGGPFLDGYIIAGIGVALYGATTDLRLDEVQVGLVAATAMVGILIGGLVGGRITDLIGRQKLFALDLTAMLVASVLCIFVQDGWQLIAVRLLAGLAVGADYPVAASMLVEWLPSRLRGRMMGVLIAMFAVGSVAAYGVAYFVSALGLEHGWRWVLASAAIPALAILLARIGTPESPRWLMQRGRAMEAREALRKAFGEYPSDEELASLAQTEPEVKKPIREVLTGPYLRRTLFVGGFWFCQVAPGYALSGFLPLILDKYGFSAGDTALLWGIGLTAVAGAATVPALFWVDRFGRRPLIIWSFVVIVVTLGALGLFPNLGQGPALVLLGLNFMATAGGSILQWIYPTELFPTGMRATAVGVATAISRLGAAAGTFLIPISLAGLGLGPTMLIGAVVAVVGLVICIAWAPETKGRPLNETAGVPGSSLPAPVGEPQPLGR